MSMVIKLFVGTISLISRLGMSFIKLYKVSLFLTTYIKFTGRIFFVVSPL